MAVEIIGEVVLPAPRPLVWQLLNEPEVLMACIPGCEILESVSETAFSAIVKIKLGPVKATFRGKVALEDLDPPNGYRLYGEGDGGVSGFAKGGARVELTDAEGGTRLRYKAEAQIGGKLAQLGARLIDGIAKKTAEEFFMRLSEMARKMRPEDAEALGFRRG